MSEAEAETQTKPAPQIRGGLRRALVRDLAVGDQSHAQLARKYNKHVQAIHQFSARNREEIDEVRRDINEEINSAWVAIKENRVAEYQQHIDDLNELLADDDLDPVIRARFIDKIFKGLHAVAEEMNELPVRVKVEPPVGTVVWNSPDVAL